MYHFVQPFFTVLGCSLGLVPAIAVILWIYAKIYYEDDNTGE